MINIGSCGSEWNSSQPEQHRKAKSLLLKQFGENIHYEWSAFFRARRERGHSTAVRRPNDSRLRVYDRRSGEMRGRQPSALAGAANARRKSREALLMFRPLRLHTPTRHMHGRMRTVPAHVTMEHRREPFLASRFSAR